MNYSNIIEKMIDEFNARGASWLEIDEADRKEALAHIIALDNLIEDNNEKEFMKSIIRIRSIVNASIGEASDNHDSKIS